MLKVSILSVLQGVAEFLPISSSGHLVIGKSLLGLGDAGMRLDIFLHVGTLLSIFVFYFAVIRRILIRREWMYVAKILVSAIPVGVVGLLFKERLEEVFSSPSFVGGASPSALADLERRAQQELARMGTAGAKKFFGIKK